MIDEQIIEVQNKKASLKDTIKSLLEDADKYLFQAEKENDLFLLMKANSFCNAAKEKGMTVKELEMTLINLNKSKEDLEKKKKN